MHRSMVWARVAVLGLLALAGCKYEPNIPAGRVKCVGDGDCPTGMTCEAIAAATEPGKRCCKSRGCAAELAGQGGAGGSGAGGGGLGGGAGSDVAPPDPDVPGTMCPPPPAMCTANTGVFCQDGMLNSCVLDGNGCLVAMAMACPTDQPCVGSFPNASCSCPPGADCAGISPGGTVCAGGMVVTCKLNDKKCVEPTSPRTCDPGKVCGGARGAAECVCGDVCRNGDGCCPGLCNPSIDTDCQWELTGGITSGGGTSSDPSGNLRIVDDGFEIGDWMCDQATKICLSGGLSP